MKPSPLFQRWFRDSQVVDDAGLPRVVYHGTAVDFAAFAPGSFFSESPSAITPEADLQRLFAAERTRARRVESAFSL